jgi:uncharacterized protein YjbI with pentapeptide repeats
MSARKTYEESVRALEHLGIIDRGQAPNSTTSVQFFRMLIADADFSNLTLPGTSFGRSEIVRSSFRNSDLRQSTMCWNDFVDVDFSDACLADCDLRASTFERCNFANADLGRALLLRDQSIGLSSEQLATIEWRDDEPVGG